MRDRYSSVGVMILGIILGAVGAIIAYAVTATNKNFDIHKIGIIILIVGIAIFLVGLVVAIVSATAKNPPPPPPPRY